MKYADDYQTLYNEKDDNYLEFVDKELKKIKRKYNSNKIQKKEMINYEKKQTSSIIS